MNQSKLGKVDAELPAVTSSDLELQISQLAERATGYVSRDKTKGRRKGDKAARDAGANGLRTRGLRHDDCYLTWRPPAKRGDRACTLGPYARWLVAARLLMSGKDGGAALIEVLTEPAPRDVNRVFGSGAHEKWRICLAARYVSPPADDAGTERVFQATIDSLNLRYAVARGSEIQRTDFLQIAVPVGPQGDTLGASPTSWLEQWIQWGVGTPSTIANELPGVPSGSSLELSPSMADRLVRMLFGAVEEEARHRVIINVHSATAVARIAEAARLRGQLVDAGQFRELLRPSEEAIPRAAQDGDFAAMFVVYVSLAAGASRRSIIKYLYEAFGLDTGTLAGLELRPVDLASDLAPLRKALTVNRVIVVFDGWENVVGPFEALHQYLCNTHWGEFLRVLAQPHLPTLQAAGGRLSPQYKLLVFSAWQAKELSPWARFATEALETAQEGVEGAAGLLSKTRAPASVIKPDAHHDAWALLVPVLALRFVAASVNGTRRTTLARCLDEWTRAFWPQRSPLPPADGSNAFAAEIEALIATQVDLLIEVADEETESLSSLQRAVELDRRPRIAARDGGIQKDYRKPQVIAFASRQLRAVFVAQWLKNADHEHGMLAKCSWAHVNFILAEETLRQGTSQLRHLPVEGIGSPYAMRRIVQAVYHGLMSLKVGENESDFSADAVSKAGLFGPALPAEVSKRYRYLYSFLYRHVIEGGCWQLSRSFGRADLRLDLLNLFVAPQYGVSMLTMPRDRQQPAWPAYNDLSRLSEPLRRDALLWCDLVEAVGRAGCDVGGNNGGAAVQWALGVLPGDTNDPYVNALLPPRSDAYYRVATSALKLQLDWLQSKGHAGDLKNAEEVCWRQLARVGIEKALFAHFEGLIQEAIAKLWDGSSGVRDAMQKAFDSILKPLMAITKSPGTRETTSGVLFRLGEILATKADNLSGPSADRHHLGAITSDSAQQMREIRAFSNACAVYWVADRMRSAAGVLSDLGVDWPLASARSMRYYVRICLKLARLLTEKSPGDDPIRVRQFANRLLEHAQNRVGVYSRHHFEFRRERDLMLMLEASRIRTWFRVEIERQSHAFRAERTRFERESANQARKRVQASLDDQRWKTAKHVYREHLDSQWTMLSGAWELLQEAENHLYSMGYPAVQIRRLCLERVKTGTAMLRLALAHAEVWQQPGWVRTKVATYLPLAWQAQRVLQDASAGSEFWTQLAHRQLASLTRATSQWDSPLTPPQNRE